MHVVNLVNLSLVNLSQSEPGLYIDWPDFSKHIMYPYYMAVSNKGWKLRYSWIWSAEIDIESGGLDFSL